MVKRWSILVGLLSFFIVIIFAFSACTALTEGANSGLTNAIGDKVAGSPGSGSWQPPKPTDNNQCLKLHGNVTTLGEDTLQIYHQMDQRFTKCYDENFKLRDGQEEAECKPIILRAGKAIDNHLIDFRIGNSVYVDICEGQDLASEGDDGGSDDPPPKEEPKDPKITPGSKNPPAPKDPADDDDWVWRCLTCIHKIDIQYVLRPTTIDLPGY